MFVVPRLVAMRMFDTGPYQFATSLQPIGTIPAIS